MESKMVAVDTGSLNAAYNHASLIGKEIESFDVFEISLVPGGFFELGPISNIKYKGEPQHVEFIGHDLRSK